ncbi:glycosyltransferase family 4 protein [Thauera sp. ZXT1-4]|uniref:glycosyltransferase family 4 protein n=1 Tax=Thauera sp. ZXT1-4 TaxID=3460294 RepID=UPI004040C107
MNNIRSLALISSQAFSIYNFRGGLVREWADLGLKVHALAPDYDEASRAKVRGLGAEPVDYPLRRTGMSPLHDLRALWALFRLLKRLDVDAVFSYFVKPVIYGNMAARLAGVQRRFSMIEGGGYVFAETPPSMYRRFLRKGVTLLYRNALKGAERVFFLNREDEALFLAGILVPEQAFLLGPIGVDLAHFAPQPVPLEPIVFLLAARLIEEKGVREFVEAARELRGQARFILLGGPDLNPNSIGRGQLEEWVRDGCIEWIDHVEDVRPIVERASVFVLPSYYREGVPRSIQEAMAMGRPVITTDMPGCRDTVVHGENGFLIKPRSIEALVDTMRVFIQNPPRAAIMGSAAQSFALEKFDAKSCNAKIKKEMGLSQ